MYSTTLFGNLTKDKLNELKGSEKPFFFYLAFQAIHGPLEAPQYYIDKYEDAIPQMGRRKKAAMMTLTDDVIQELVDTLKDNGQWDNTLLVFFFALLFFLSFLLPPATVNCLLGCVERHEMNPAHIDFQHG